MFFFIYCLTTKKGALPHHCFYHLRTNLDCNPVFFFFTDAISNMESLLSSSSAWTLKYKDVGDVDDTRTPECAEGFMTLLSVITGVVYGDKCKK